METNRNPLIQLLIVSGLFFFPLKDEAYESNFFDGGVVIDVPGQI